MSKRRPLTLNWSWIRLDNEEDWKDLDEWRKEVERRIDTDRFYFVMCPHCRIVFFIEEAVDRGYHARSDGEPTFKLTCPFCETSIEQVAVRRLKIKFEKVVKEDEYL